MSKNRKFQMFFTVALIVTAFMAALSAISVPALSKADPARLSNYPDYYQRHPELYGASGRSVDNVEDRAPLDECFDVSISELTACRAASTIPSP